MEGRICKRNYPPDVVNSVGRGMERWSTRGLYAGAVSIFGEILAVSYFDGLKF